jgi:seryl-tRNA synthetase
MLDIKFIRDNKDLIEMAARKKHVKFDVSELITIDNERRELLAAVEARRAEQNAVSATIVTVSPEEKAVVLEKMKALKTSMQKDEDRLKEVQKNWTNLMLQVPNIPDVSVPEGTTDEENLETRTWGEKPTFSFEAKDHVELMTALGMVDFDRGAKVHGFRGYFLTGQGAQLARSYLKNHTR